MRVSKRFFCIYNLGDHIFLLWFLNNAAKLYPDVDFSFCPRQPYLDEVRRLAAKLPNLEIAEKNDGHNLDGWMGQDNIYGRFRGDGSRFIDFQIVFHRMLAEKIGLPNWPIIDRRSMLLPAENMSDNHPLKDESFDVLFINSAAMSGQCSGWNQERIHELAVKTARRYRTVVTHPCGCSAPVTTQLGMKLCHLGELASRCRIVAGVTNSPFLSTFNELAFPNVKMWLNYSQDCVNFDNDRVRHCREINDIADALSL